ncbi:unnamed protein product [Dovyalis caffra]|uniref:Uncharacterized protein n=1 Tax=Dovyalis caffra TaxID=77055 RepID=A0AAV1RXY6_9ROSI|nr:unnamed protein product [Dovyalis caffra]
MVSSSLPPPSLLLLFSLIFASSVFLSRATHETALKGIDPENPALKVTPSHLNEHVFGHDGSKDVFFCERVKVSGHSRWTLSSYASSFRVTLDQYAEIPERLHSKIQVCFHRNASLGLCQCEKDDWRTVQKGLWRSVMSPYEERYVDVKFISDTSEYVSIAVDEGNEIVANWKEKYFLSFHLWISGAGLGYWMVRKFVISKDGSVDDGVAQFVKWAMRIIASTFIFQHSGYSFSNGRLGFFICNLLSYFEVVVSNQPTMISYSDQSDYWCGNAWHQPAGQATARYRRAEFLSRTGKMSPRGKMWTSPKSSFAWTSSPVKGLVSPSSHSATTDKQNYYSTFHSTPKRKKFTKKQWEDFTRESTRQALSEWAASPEVANWIIENADRIQLHPSDCSSEEMVESESDSTDETVAGSGKPFRFFNW